MMRTKTTVCLLLLFYSACFFAQEKQIISFDAFIQMVNDHHPITYKANLLLEVARANEKMARGGFDPKVGVDYNHKSFDKKPYFSLLNSHLKIPSWYGLEFKAGYDNTSGLYVNDSDELPSSGLLYAGISVPIAQGLIIDERRATLQKAKILNQANEVERSLVLNDLFFQAATAYIEWQKSYQEYMLAIEGVEYADLRLDGTIKQFLNGDKPAIDTLESEITVQNRKIYLAEANQKFIKAGWVISNFLWKEGSIPLEINDSVIPEQLEENTLISQMEQVAMNEDTFSNHPLILRYNYKIKSLQVDRKLSSEMLKPDVRISYNPLYAPSNEYAFNIANYKLGLSAYYPILTRKERGKLRLVNLKIKNEELNRSLKQQEITSKQNTYLHIIDQLQYQNSLTKSNAENYLKLLNAENTKYQIGESSIFLINSREVKYLDSRKKMIHVLSEILLSRLRFLHSLGKADSLLTI